MKLAPAQVLGQRHVRRDAPSPRPHVRRALARRARPRASCRFSYHSRARRDADDFAAARSARRRRHAAAERWPRLRRQRQASAQAVEPAMPPQQPVLPAIAPAGFSAGLDAAALDRSRSQPAKTRIFTMRGRGFVGDTIHRSPACRRGEVRAALARRLRRACAPSAASADGTAR